MSTAAQSAANLANARLSTRPRTDEGKAKSSRNSLKHGLTALTVLLPDEDPAQYQTFSAAMMKDFDPYNSVDAALATELIDLQWRLQRVSRLEARILSAEAPDFKALNNISLHAARMKRQYSATLKEFDQIHRASGVERKDLLAEAEMIHQADQILNRPSTLAEYGFDFTLDDLETHLRRKAGLKAADETIAEYKCPFLPDTDTDSFNEFGVPLNRAA